MGGRTAVGRMTDPRPGKPRVSFDSGHIMKRLESCKTVAAAHGWHPNNWIAFEKEVRDAFSYEEAMAVIRREFDVVPT